MKLIKYIILILLIPTYIFAVEEDSQTPPTTPRDNLISTPSQQQMNIVDSNTIKKLVMDAINLPYDKALESLEEAEKQSRHFHPKLLKTIRREKQRAYDIEILTRIEKEKLRRSGGFSLNLKIYNEDPAQTKKRIRKFIIAKNAKNFTAQVVPNDQDNDTVVHNQPVARRLVFE